MAKKISRQTKKAPKQTPRRAIELFASDSPFKPKIIPAKKQYSRKNTKVDNDE